ncbi:unnamed protein product [Caenorhabditis sp. 36 PRJEB53466]|nr:unnamed protein product [Caenorhabditis sp. 36 PRJEB53466]
MTFYEISCRTKDDALIVWDAVEELFPVLRTLMVPDKESLLSNFMCKFFLIECSSPFNFWWFKEPWEYLENSQENVEFLTNFYRGSMPEKNKISGDEIVRIFAPFWHFYYGKIILPIYQQKNDKMESIAQLLLVLFDFAYTNLSEECAEHCRKLRNIVLRELRGYQTDQNHSERRFFDTVENLNLIEKADKKFEEEIQIHSSFPAMLLIHYYNVSHFRTTDYLFRELTAFLYAETLMYLFDTLNIMFYIWVLFSASQFHFNFNLISGTQYIIHLVDNIAMLVIRVQWVVGHSDDSDPSSNPIFFWAMNCSVFCIVFAMCSLPFFIIERCFATFHLKDYETNQRRYLSYVLVFLLNAIGLCGTFILQNKAYTCFVVCGLIAINGIALSLNCFLRFWNTRKFNECHKIQCVGCQRKGQYSLAKRFQISENINSLHMLNIIIMYMGLMNAVLILSMLFSSFDVSPELQAVCSLILDASVFAYSFTLPQIMTCFCQKWRVQKNAFKQRLGCLKSHRKKSLPPLRDTFGIEMRSSDATNKYFDQLKDSWEKR